MAAKKTGGDAQAERIERYYDGLKGWAATYHHHKEVMAHSILVVMLGVAAAVVTSKWPTPSLTGSTLLIVRVSTGALLLALYAGVCGQLFNKRLANALHELAEEMLRKIAVDGTGEASMPPQLGPSTRLEKVRTFFVVHLLPPWFSQLIERQVRRRVIVHEYSEEALQRAMLSAKAKPTYDDIIYSLSFAAVVAAIVWPAIGPAPKVEPAQANLQRAPVISLSCPASACPTTRAPVSAGEKASEPAARPPPPPPALRPAASAGGPPPAASRGR